MENQDTEKHENGNKYWAWLPTSFALAGIIVFIFATHGPPASSSGFVSALKGAIGEVAPEYVKGKTHYQIIKGPGSWLMAFVVGMAAGGFIAGRTSKCKIDDIPKIWQERIGPQKWKRYLATFMGGFLILFSARLAGGCTLGLFMSGTIQLAVSGLYFGILIFAFAMFSARLVYSSPNGKDK